MKLFNILSILITLSALFSYINHRYIRLPTTIGLMLIALITSLGIIGLDYVGLHWEDGARELLNSIDFDETLLHGMLAFLLFAGALHIDLGSLHEQKWIVGVLATIGVAGSTVLTGLLCWWAFGWIGLDIPLIFCFLFGALISPTDPIAVLSILKVARVPKSLETIIAGESLFNDGVAVVVFLALVELASAAHPVTGAQVALLLFKEAFGGIALGLAVGAIGFYMLKRVDNYQVEVLITLAMAAGGFALADNFHLSGPIATVVSGLLVGNHGRMLAMSEKTVRHLDPFWELVDESLNAVLFVLIGLEVLVISFSGKLLVAGLLAIPIAVSVRFFSVSAAVAGLSILRTFPPNVIPILSWAGLRGGISVALALSLPPGPHREAIISLAYCVVVFSILVQGLSIGKLAKRLGK